MAWTRNDAFMELRVRRSLAVGILISILIHALILLFVIRARLETSTGTDLNAPEGLAVRLAPLPAAPPPKPKSEPQVETPPVPEEKPRPQTRSRTVMTVLNNSSRSVATSPEPPAPTTPTNNAPPVDMLSMVTASRERRHQQDDDAARENAAAEAANAEPSADQLAIANLQRNLQKIARAGKGESGIFQIRSMGVRTAQFSFRGWTDDSSNSTLQVIDVDAGPGGNVQLAVVRRMIQLIRTHYTGDFNFDSHRLGRVVVQSARLEDTAQLEAFLRQEFFGG
jgi:hypothetical protein